VFIGREHNNKCTHYGSNLEACTFVVNQDQAFEAGFSNEGQLCMKQSGTQSGLDK
jgi:hypothetical protein